MLPNNCLKFQEKTAIRHPLLILPVIALTVLLSSCNLPYRSPWDKDAPARPVISAEELQRNRLHLEAADHAILAGNSAKARSILDTIDPGHLSTSQQAQFGLLQAQVQLSAGNPEQALAMLGNIAYQELNSKDLRNFHSARAFAYSLTGQQSASAQARIDLAPLLTTAKDQNDNQTAILDALTQLPASELQNRQQDVPGGWMALAELLTQHARGSKGYRAALQKWQQDYPHHPANLSLLRNYTNKALVAVNAKQGIAILLPQSGPLQQAGEAIKAGFVAAERENRAERPKIRFYDSEAAAPEILYQKAIADGAGLIVGPLEKDKLKQLAEMTPLTVPVLALNQIPGLSAKNLYQFTLSPVDEAEQAASKAWSDERRRAAILVPDTELGKRVAQAYANIWRRNKGTITKIQYFNANTTDFSQIVPKLLGIEYPTAAAQSESEQNSSIEPADGSNNAAIDALFITADSKTASLLNQQLKIYRPDGIPVYATPHLYNNSSNPATDEGLEGITFCDIPWFFPGVYHDNINATALQTPWKQKQSIYLRLLAMGIDAYNLTARLQQLSSETYRGATGNLSLLRDGRIRRTLFCARFAGGIPEPLGFLETPHDFYLPSGGTDAME